MKLLVLLVFLLLKSDEYTDVMNRRMTDACQNRLRLTDQRELAICRAAFENGVHVGLEWALYKLGGRPRP